jgi:hypothetical protein
MSFPESMLKSHTSVPSFASQASTWFAMLATIARTRVWPLPIVICAAINTCASAPTSSPAIERLNTFSTSRDWTAEAVNRGLLALKPLRVLS